MRETQTCLGISNSLIEFATCSTLKSAFCSVFCLRSDKVQDPNCRVPWSTFCVDPWSAAEVLHDRGCIKRSKSYLYFHMEDQYHCMKTAEGGWAVDFIGRVEEPNDDWAEVSRSLM